MLKEEGDKDEDFLFIGSREPYAVIAGPRRTRLGHDNQLDAGSLTRIYCFVIGVCGTRRRELSPFDLRLSGRWRSQTFTGRYVTVLKICSRHSGYLETK
jgi:hypothetical protein